MIGFDPGKNLLGHRFTGMERLVKWEIVAGIRA
jgi:hypothetical protein